MTTTRPPSARATTRPPSPLRRTPSLRLVVLAWAAVGRAALAQSTTTVDIRTSITLPAGTPVLLKNIATVAGPDADRLSTIVILHADETKDPAPPTRTLSRDTLRATIGAATISVDLHEAGRVRRTVPPATLNPSELFVTCEFSTIRTPLVPTIVHAARRAV